MYSISIRDTLYRPFGQLIIQFETFKSLMEIDSSKRFLRSLKQKRLRPGPGA